MSARPESDLVWLAQTLGYSDQAHFSKEFKSFCGMTPSQFLRSRGSGRSSPAPQSQERR